MRFGRLMRVGAVDFGGDLDGEFGFGECFGGVVGVREWRGEEVASEGDEDFDFALVECFDGRGGVVAVFFRRDEMEFLAEGGHEFVGHFFPRCRRYGRPGRWSVRVRGKGPRPWRPIWPRRRWKLTMDWTLATPFLCWVMLMHQQGDHAFGMGGDVGGVVDLIARDTGLLDYFFPGFVAEVVGEGFEAFGIVGDEIVVEDFSAGEGVLFEHVFHDAFYGGRRRR